MVKWYSQLFLDGITKHTVEYMKSHVEKEKLQYPIFLVALASNESNLLDILPVNELLFPYYKRRMTYVLGAASTRKQAKIMAAAIVTRVYEETGGFDIREWSGYNKE